MTVEEPQEQRLRRVTMKCGHCLLPIQVGPNYPDGVPVSTLKTLELFCRYCTTISLLANPLLTKEKTDAP